MIEVKGTAVEIAGFLKGQLTENGFTEEEAFLIARDYVLGHLGLGG